MGFGLEAVLAKAADSRPAARAQSENDCRAQFCTLITTLEDAQERREAWSDVFSNLLSKQVAGWQDWEPMSRSFEKVPVITHPSISASNHGTVG